MAHHSSQMDDELQKSFAYQMLGIAKKIQEEANRLNLGPTGQFPEGKLVEHDEGEIKLAIGTYKGKVFINFGTPMVFIAFTAEQAEEIAKILKHHATGLMNQSAAWRKNGRTEQTN
jgi:hypothetical protein